MKTVFNFRQQIKHFKSLFDGRTYRTFQAVVEGMVRLNKWTQGDLACLADKTLRQIQYFFSAAKWSVDQLNVFRLRFVQNKKDFRDRKSDFAALDGSTTKKDKDAHFGDLVSHVWSGRDHQVVNGLKFFGASVQTKTGLKYILDFSLYFSRLWKSETEAWKVFMTTVAKKSKAWLFVLDSGFRSQYIAQHIYKTLRRTFLVRILPSQCVWVKRKRKKSCMRKRKKDPQYSLPDRRLLGIKSFLKNKNAIHVEKGKVWVIPHVILNAWKGTFREEVTVIVYHRDGFKKPIVLCLSQAAVTQDEAFGFVQTYFKRWKIEQLFKEIKSWFQFEKFKITSLEGIQKYLHMVVLIHTLFAGKQAEIEHIPKLKRIIQVILKAKRNITEFTLIGLKLLVNMVSFPTSFRSIKRLLYAQNISLSYRFL